MKTITPCVLRTFTDGALASAIAIALFTGCRSLGPGTVGRDRFEYSTAIGDSWKRQTLLNIVKLRYLDPPIFVDVGQIVSGYSLERGVSVSGQLAKSGAGDQFAAAGAHAILTDRPTITYTPLTGNKFVKSLMTPLTPESVFFMIQAGWPADNVLLLTLASINGLKNQESTINGTVPPDKDFLRALALLRRIQLSSSVAFRVRQDAKGQQTALLNIYRENITPEALADSTELRRLLRLDPDATEFELVFGAVAANNQEVAVLTRSILHLMQTMAAQVEVPPQDLAQHNAAPGWESAPDLDMANRLIQIRSSKDAPARAYVAVSYNDYWFWIDKHDLKSKRVFASMMMLFTLADSGEKEALPLITIPAQ